MNSCNVRRPQGTISIAIYSKEVPRPPARVEASYGGAVLRMAPGRPIHSASPSCAFSCVPAGASQPYLRSTPVFAPVWHTRPHRPVSMMLGVLLCALTACVVPASYPLAPGSDTGVHLSLPLDPVKLLNRVTWGANDTAARQLTALGTERFLALQLHPTESAPLPTPVHTQLEAMTIAHQPMDQLVVDLEQRRKDAEAITNDDAKQAAHQAYQQELNRLGRAAATRR